MYYMKQVFLIKFKKTPVMQGRYGALVIVDGSKGSIERAIIRETGMLSTKFVADNIESVKLMGIIENNKVKKEVVILNEQQYHSSLSRTKNKDLLN